jgi:hypothetical protein
MSALLTSKGETTMTLEEACDHVGEILVHKFLDQPAEEAELVKVGDGGALHVRFAGSTEVVTMHPRFFEPKEESAEALYLGAATGVNGEDLHVCRKPDGGVIAYGSKGTVLEFYLGPSADLRELLDRAAMPGAGARDGEAA